MAASKSTVQAIARILVKNLTASKARELVLEIQHEVDGNASFRTTINNLEKELRRA